MRTFQVLLLVQGIMGAFDTLWFHEWRARLPSQPTAVRELQLHAVRDFIYAIVFGTLGWLAWQGLLAWLLALLLLCEIGITLLDFREEAATRTLHTGERSTHALMGIVYGAFLAYLVPELWEWSAAPTGFVVMPAGWLAWLLSLMGVGVLASGLRDAVAASRLTARSNRRPVATAEQQVR